MILSLSLCVCDRHVFPFLSACRKLLDLGWSKEYINEMVKEKAMSESESIYGTLYGALGVDQQEENMYVMWWFFFRS